MTERVSIPADQPDASFGQIGDKFFGIYRLPFGSWRELVDRHQVRMHFNTSQEATRAAFAKVNSLLFRPIQTQAVAADDAEAKLQREVQAFKAQKHQRVVRRGDGKPSFIVETKRKR